MSAKTTWTPGPWVCEGRTVYALTESGEYRKGQPLLVNRFYAGLQASGRRGADDGELMSNANLIAAAPELYAALELAEAHIAELVDAWQRGALSEHDMLGGTRSNRNHDCWVAIRRACAKARGEGGAK